MKREEEGWGAMKREEGDWGAMRSEEEGLCMRSRSKSPSGRGSCEFLG